MEKEIRKLKRRVSYLESSGHARNPTDQPSTPARSQQEKFNGWSQEDLDNAISHLGETEKVEILKVTTFKLFTPEELASHSLTGKKSVKSGENPRPAIDQKRLEVLEATVRRKTNMDHAQFFSKLQNIQKTIRKRGVTGTP